MDGKEEITGSVYPLGLVARQTAARDDAMEMGMKAQIPGPGVQDSGNSKLGSLAKPFRIRGQGKEGVGGGFKKEGEYLGAIVPREAVQLAREGEDEVKIMNRQDALKASLDPSGLIKCLAFWAMAIPARVVGGFLETAVGTAIDVTAKGDRPAGDDRAGNIVLGKSQSVEFAIVVEVVAKDVRHLDRRARGIRARGTAGVR
jgi:hypothetical protein